MEAIHEGPSASEGTQKKHSKASSSASQESNDNNNINASSSIEAPASVQHISGASVDDGIDQINPPTKISNVTAKFQAHSSSEQ